MSGFQGSISFTNKNPPSGFINIAGARSGTSIDAGNFVNLGQPVGAAGNPAILLHPTEIPTGGFPTFFTGTGNLIIGRNTDGGEKLQAVFNTNSGTATGLFSNPNSGNFAYAGFQLQNDAGIGAFVYMSSSTYTPAPPNALVLQNKIAGGPVVIDTETAGLFVRFLDNGRALIGMAADNGAQLQVQTDAAIGGVATASAILHIGPGDAAPGNGPIKLTAGTLLAAPENGVFEFDGTHLYFTIGVTRNTIV